MIGRLDAWLEHRTGYRGMLRSVLYEPIPGGARWRYVWGSTLVFTFTVQVITGLCLWTAYSPGVQNAWASVLYIEEFMLLGSLVRGIHHYTAQAMVILLGLHVLQVILDGAYRAPREVNYWLGWILAMLVLAMALTGYLLPWDQKGFYATQVATKIAGATPFIGELVQRLIQGGNDYGQHTLTRFFALHAGILPISLVLFLVPHVYLFRRHGIHVRPGLQGPTGWFWPDQLWKDGAACLVVSAIVVGLAYWRGAELSPPADLADPYAAARPEWYFLSLFRVLKFEWVEQLGLAFGAIVLPGIVMLVFLLMPLIAYVPAGHLFNSAFTWLTAAVVVGLTGVALYEDAIDPDHQAAIAEAHRTGARARELALGPSRVPPDGPLRLLRSDPMTQGPRVFAQHCSSCHHFQGHNGRGRQVFELDPQSGQRVAAKPLAPDLGDLGSRKWMRSILVDFENHFASFRNAPWFGVEEGIDPSDSEMADWSGDRQALLSRENAPDLSALVEFLVGETSVQQDGVNRQLVMRGRELALEGTWTRDISISCTDCHDTLGEKFDPDNEGGSGYPELAEYLSYPWLVDFLSDPGSEQHYGDRNQMPAYKDQLTTDEMDLLVRWLLEHSVDSSHASR